MSWVGEGSAQEHANPDIPQMAPTPRQAPPACNSTFLKQQTLLGQASVHTRGSLRAHSPGPRRQGSSRSPLQKENWGVRQNGKRWVRVTGWVPPFRSLRVSTSLRFKSRRIRSCPSRASWGPWTSTFTPCFPCIYSALGRAGVKGRQGWGRSRQDWELPSGKSQNGEDGQVPAMLRKPTPQLRPISSSPALPSILAGGSPHSAPHQAEASPSHTVSHTPRPLLHTPSHTSTPVMKDSG